MSSASFQLFGHINGQKHKVGTQGKHDSEAIMDLFSPFLVSASIVP
jgi:hypothetical protein